MQKRGQITLFIILGVVIVSVVVLGFFFREQIAKTATIEEAAGVSALPPDLEQLREEISDCAKTVSNEAIYITGQQGGYFVAPEDAISSMEYDIALGVNKELKSLISENELKEEIGSYIQTALPLCINFDSYETFDIFDTPPVTQINLNDESTDLTIAYRVNAQKDDNAYNLVGPYEVVLPLRVKKVYEVSSKIADEVAIDKENLDIARLLSYGMDVDVYSLGDGFMVIAVKDKNTDAENNYEFLFGVAL